MSDGKRMNEVELNKAFKITEIVHTSEKMMKDSKGMWSR